MSSLLRNAVVLSLCANAFSCTFVKTPATDSALKSEDGNIFEPLNPDTMFQVLYEVQVRTANACREDTGSAEQKQKCAQKIAPPVKYRAESWAVTADCGTDEQAKDMVTDLQKTKLGTIEDMLENTTDYHVGVTLKYIKEKLGLNTVWIMPVFMNNDRWNIPARCDNLGSPYAVRDYLHVAGSLSRVCIQAGKDEYAQDEGEQTPCFGNVSFDELISKANSLGLRVMMDVALNHFGHNYRYYDYVDYMTTRGRVEAGQNLDDLWNFSATEEASLIKPEILDTPEKMMSLLATQPSIKGAYDSVHLKCPAFKGDILVRAVNMYRNMLDWERAQFSCDQPVFLEHAAPGFYAGEGGYNNPHPSRHIGDNFTNNWSDVKFLYHQEKRGSDERGQYYDVFVRNREYFFRILNYWVSRGVQGFRLDHATDGDSGMAPNEWRYILRKVNHYDWLRKGKPADHHKPIYMAEEFGDQMGMNQVVDLMTEGYVFNIRQSAEKNTAFVQQALDSGNRFEGHTMVMRALETHDEPRLLTGTGFDEWTGAGFWSLGAETWSVPMLLMGQEFGEKYGLSFRRSDLLRSRFYDNPNHFDKGQDLVNFYGSMIKARFDGKNHALLSTSSKYLPLKNNDANDPRLFAIMKWWGNDVIFAFNNLWEQGTVEQAFYIPPDIADSVGIRGDLKYRLVNILSNAQVGECRTGDELKTDFYVKLETTERLQWLRLELCPN